MDFSQLFQYNISKYESIISQYKGNNLSNFGIKVIDNYKSYLLVKEPKGEHDQYIKEGQKYELKFTDKENNNATAKLLKATDTEEYHYIIFQLENGIEHIADLRTINVEIVWNKTEGMAVPKNAIQKTKRNGYYYVTLVYGSQYIEVPIHIVIESDNICIVENYTKEEKAQIGISTSYILEIYDKLVIE